MEQGRSKQHIAQNEKLQGISIVIIVILIFASLMMTTIKKAVVKIAYNAGHAQRQ